MENSQKLDEKIKKDLTTMRSKTTGIIEIIGQATSINPIDKVKAIGNLISLPKTIKEERRGIKETQELISDYNNLSSKIREYYSKNTKNTNNPNQNQNKVKVVENKAFKENLDKVARYGFSEATIATVIAESSHQTKQVNLVRNSNSLITKQEEQQHQYKIAQGM